MNISRYANIDKFVNIRYFFTSPSGIQLIISASPNVEITSPGCRASGFFYPLIVNNFFLTKVSYFKSNILQRPKRLLRKKLKKTEKQTKKEDLTKN